MEEYHHLSLPLKGVIETCIFIYTWEGLEIRQAWSATTLRTGDIQPIVNPITQGRPGGSPLVRLRRIGHNPLPDQAPVLFAHAMVHHHQ